jgi:hypothetical protein
MNNSNTLAHPRRREFLVSALALASVAASVSASTASFAAPVTLSGASNSREVTLYGRRFRLHGFWLHQITAASDLQRVATSSMFDLADLDAGWPIAVTGVCDLAISVRWFAGNDDPTLRREWLLKCQRQSNPPLVLLMVAFGDSINVDVCADVAASVRCDGGEIDMLLVIPVVDECLSPGTVRATAYMRTD